ncbi:hypothetical protein [Actinomadura harenae]|uniref:hypothetical protein n=1 Tax=Actinomadura harenae TaxID=2483351 RepID=UPI0018F7BA93|nr:hypothetical protein [Actinomadura harenae]
MTTGLVLSVAERIRRAGGGRVDAFVDTFGDGYVDLAVELGVRPERINTICDWESAARVGARTFGEGSAASSFRVSPMLWPWPRTDHPRVPSGQLSERKPA